MENLKQLYKFKRVIIIGIIFLTILLGGIVSKMELYADDFFYITFLNDGWQNFIDQNIVHYQEVNGRVFVHILAEILLNSHRMIYLLFLLLCLGYIFYAASSFLLQKTSCFNLENCLTSICISFSLFFCITVFILKETVFWITGAMNYILPVAISFLAISIIQKLQFFFSPNKHSTTSFFLI